MRLRISPNRLISEVQKDFNSAFPYLKIEFFRNKVFQQPDFSCLQIVPHNQKIGNSQLAIRAGDIDIDPEMKVNEVEKIFKDQFSLLVQVFRRSGNLWLQTTMTDNWSLARQNEHGREISIEDSGKNNREKIDYDLRRDDLNQ